MNTDYSYCRGRKPYKKCAKCKRFLRNYESKTPHLWMIEPCKYEPIKEEMKTAEEYEQKN